MVVVKCTNVSTLYHNDCKYLIWKRESTEATSSIQGVVDIIEVGVVDKHSRGRLNAPYR